MKTVEEINQIREVKRKELDLRVNTEADTREKHILVCHGKFLKILRELSKKRTLRMLELFKQDVSVYVLKVL